MTERQAELPRRPPVFGITLGVAILAASLGWMTELAPAGSRLVTVGLAHAGQAETAPAARA